MHLLVKLNDSCSNHFYSSEMFYIYLVEVDNVSTNLSVITQIFTLPDYSQPLFFL